MPGRPTKPQTVTYREVREPRKPNPRQRLAFSVLGFGILAIGLGVGVWLLNAINNPSSPAESGVFPTATLRPTPTFDSELAKASLSARHNDTNPASSSAKSTTATRATVAAPTKSSGGVGLTPNPQCATSDGR